MKWLMRQQNCLMWLRGSLMVLMVLIAMQSMAQVRSAAPKGVLRGLVPDKWQVQHYHTSYDGRTMVISALAPGEKHYDLYILTATRGVWTKPQRLGEAVNSSMNEYWPCLSPDGETIYFARETAPATKKEDARYILMLSNKTETGWSSAQALIVSEGYDVSPYMLPDNRTMLLARAVRSSNKQMQYGLYRMERLDKVNWTDPAALLVPEDRDTHYYGFSVSGRQVRYTIETIERRDTSTILGDYTLPDSLLWRPTMTIEGQTLGSEGRLLPVQIIIRDGITSTVLATASSDGRYRLALPQGIRYVVEFYAEGTNHHYLEPDCRELQHDTTIVADLRFDKNLTINLHVYDALDNTQISRSSHRLPIGQVHRLPISRHAYRDTVITIDTRNPVLMTHSELDVALMPATAPLTIRAVDAETDSVLSSQSLIARQGQAYPFHLEAVGYTYADTVIRIPMRDEPIQVTVPLRTLRADMIMQLRSISFEYNSAELKEESFDELEKVVRLLALNSDLHIELAAHTDDVGSDSYNDRLSQRRGETVRQYILSKGIAPERIVAKGYGKRRPLVANDTEEHRAMNRRVEFKILGL